MTSEQETAMYDQPEPDDERTPEFEALADELSKHEPVTSFMDNNSIVGCLCMDRHFQESEDWGTHLAEIFKALAIHRPASRRDPRYEREALIRSARASAERRWPIPVNYHEGDPQHTIIVAQRHAYLLGVMDTAGRTVQGEPKHARECIDWCNHCQVCGVNILYGSRCRAHYLNQPQGEPSDAVVEAARAVLEDHLRGHVGEVTVRAALKAAAAVQGGETR